MKITTNPYHVGDNANDTLLDTDGHGLFVPEMLEEYDQHMEHEFVALRESRAKETTPTCGRTYDDVWDNMSQLELNYYRGKWLRISPEERAKHFGKSGRIEDKEVYGWFNAYKRNPRKNILGHVLPPPLRHT